MFSDAHTNTTSPSVEDATVKDASALCGYVKRHPVHFKKENVATLATAAELVPAPMALDLVPALSSFLGEALAWGLGVSAAPSTNTVGCNSGSNSNNSPSVPIGGEPLPEPMQRSLRVAWPKVNWRELHKLRHAHYYTGEVATPSTNLQDGNQKEIRRGSVSAPCEACDSSSGNQIVPGASAESGTAESDKGASTTPHEDTAVSLIDASHKQSMASLCTRILPSAEANGREKRSVSSISTKPTDRRQPHGYGVLLYIIYGQRRKINGSAPATSTATATGCVRTSSETSAEHLIPFALVPKAYCPVADLFDQNVPVASLNEMAGSSPQATQRNEKSVPLQSAQERNKHDDTVAVLSLVIYEGGFWRGQPHGKGRLLVFQRFILEGEWVHGAPQLKGVCVLRKIFSHQINAPVRDQFGKCFDYPSDDKGKYETYPHDSSQGESLDTPQNTVTFSEVYMGTLSVGINSAKTLSPDEAARLSEPWKRQSGMSWTINPRISLLYNGHGEALSTPGGHTQPLYKAKVAVSPYEPRLDNEGGIAMERKGITWYCGEWAAGERHGVGAEWRSAGPNHGLYLGSYEHDQRHGPGILEYDNGEETSLHVERGGDCGSVLSGTWKQGVLQPTATLLLSSNPFMSLQGTHWKRTSGLDAPGDVFLFDQALFMKGQHSLSCMWEPTFKKFDVALGSLPSLEGQLSTHLKEPKEGIATEGSEDNDEGERLFEYVRPILKVVISLNEWEEVLFSFQSLFYFIFGKCPGSKMHGREKYQQRHCKENEKSKSDTVCNARLSSNDNTESNLRGAANNATDTDSLLKRLEQLGSSTPLDPHAFNSYRNGSQSTPYPPLFSSPSWCQLMGLSTAIEATGCSQQVAMDVQDLFMHAEDENVFETHHARQFSVRAGGYGARRMLDPSCLHAYSANPAYTSLPALRGLSLNTIAERACHYAASFVTSIRLRLIPFVALNPVMCEEIMRYKVLERFGWNVVYCLVGPLLYDLCNAVVIQKHVELVSTYLRNSKNLENHYTMRQSRVREQCFSFSAASQHDMRLADLHSAVSRLLHETNFSRSTATKRVNLEPCIKTCGKHKSNTHLGKVEATASLCDDDLAEQKNVKVAQDRTSCARYRVDLGLEKEEEELIDRAACAFSNPALYLALECQHTSCGQLFAWHSASHTFQEAVLGSSSSSEASLFYSPTTLSDSLDLLTSLVHLSVAKYPNEPLFRQDWLGKCVLSAACKAAGMAMKRARQKPFCSPFYEEALRQSGFSPFACVLLVCLTTLGWTTPTLPLTKRSRLLLYDLDDQSRHRNPVQSLLETQRVDQSTPNEDDTNKRGNVSRITAEVTLTDVLLNVYNATCRLVHCYPHLLRPARHRNAVDDDVCIFPLDELYVRAQYCASLCGAQRFLKKITTAKEAQAETRVGLPLFTRFNQPFSSCTLSESALSRSPLPGKPPLHSPSSLAEATDHSTDGLDKLKDFLKKTLQLTKEAMMDHLEQYWSERSTWRALPTGTGYSETEEKDTEDCKQRMSASNDEKQAPMQQEVSKVALDSTQDVRPPASQFRAQVPSDKNEPLSDLAVWVFKCLNTVLQDADTNLSSRGNAYTHSTVSEVVDSGEENRCEREVFVWRHFEHGFQQPKQCTPAGYPSATRCASVLPPSLSRGEHDAEQQYQRGQDELTQGAINTGNQLMPSDVATATPCRYRSTGTVGEDTFAYLPLLSEQDFCYIALLVLFLVELDLRIEFLVRFVWTGNNDEAVDTETDPPPSNHLDRRGVQSTVNTNCMTKSENNNANRGLQCDSTESLLQNPSGDLIGENCDSIAQNLFMEKTTGKDVYAIGRAQKTTCPPPMDAPHNLDASAVKVSKNHERVCSSAFHEDPLQRTPEGIQGREFILTLSMPSTFRQSLGSEVLESAWLTVAVMFGGSALSLNKKL